MMNRLQKVTYGRNFSLESGDFWSYLRPLRAATTGTSPSWVTSDCAACALSKRIESMIASDRTQFKSNLKLTAARFRRVASRLLPHSSRHEHVSVACGANVSEDYMVACEVTSVGKVGVQCPPWIRNNHGLFVICMCFPVSMHNFKK